MKKFVFLFAVLFSLAACKTEVKKETTADAEAIPEIAMGEFATKAGDFIDKEIKIKGIVDHVCKHSGKKLLVVTDDGQVHVTSEVRFDDAIMGSEIMLTGVVVEDRIDESTCLQMEEDNIKSHTEGASNDDQFASKKQHIEQYREKMKTEKLEYISEFTLKYIAHQETK